MPILINIIKNKYLLALMGFAVWLLFFDKNDLLSQLNRKKELKGLLTKVSYYREQINIVHSELKNLQNNPSTLEKYAREKYFMKRDNEDVFIIETAPRPKFSAITQ